MIDTTAFIENGIHHFKDNANPNKALSLISKIKSLREFSPNLFNSEDEFRKNPIFKGVNPMPGRNLAESLEEETLFIENDPQIQKTLNAILGENYQIIDKKFVCGIPKEWTPEWVKSKIEDTGVKNLGPYIKPEYRDITYFSGIDFHQDIIDYPEMGPNFITMYVYLEDVSENDAPLYLMPKTHKFGATKFPHNLEKINSDTWEYKTEENAGIFKHNLLTGKCGDISLWHSFILHGTQPDTNSKPRISLRYIIKSTQPNAHCALNEINKTISGEMSLSKTRIDLDPKGAAILKGNHVNKIIA